MTTLLRDEDNTRASPIIWDVTTTPAGDFLVARTTYGSFALGSQRVEAQTPVIVLAKLDAAGQTQWVKAFAYENSVRLRLAADTAGAPTLLANVCGRIDFGWVGNEGTCGGPYGQTIVASFDEQGNVRSSTAFGDGRDQYAGALAVTGQGRVIVGGYFGGTLSLGGNTYSADPSTLDSFVASFDSSGTLQWHQVWADHIHASDLVASQEHVLAGGASGTGALQVTEFDENGQIVRELTLPPDEGSASARKLIVDEDGSIVVLGWLTGTMQLGGATITGESEFLARAGSYTLQGGDVGCRPFASTPAGFVVHYSPGMFD